MTSTTDTTNAIITYLNLQGHYVWRNQTVGKVRGHFYINKRGVSDIVGLLSDGTHIEVEVKIGADRLSLDQIKHADKIKYCHGLHFVAKSFDDFERQWKQHTAPTGMLGDAQGRAAVKR